MVTEAGKELLRNTINTVKFHNKIIEENEMWRQFELERGLTMMVSDDLILKRMNKRHHLCSKHRKKEEPEPVQHGKKDLSVASTSKDTDRWDHNGFKELYPTETRAERKWDHSGFLELYPEEAKNVKVTAPATEEIPKKKKKKRKTKEESSSDTEIWEEFKKFKRKKKLKKLKEGSEHKNISKSYDSHIKDWKKRMKN